MSRKAIFEVTIGAAVPCRKYKELEIDAPFLLISGTLILQPEVMYKKDGGRSYQWNDKLGEYRTVDMNPDDLVIPLAACPMRLKIV